MDHHHHPTSRDGRLWLPGSLGGALAAQRLEHRVDRIDRVLRALAARAREHERAHGEVPGPLRAATDDFEGQLREAREELRSFGPRRR